MVWARFAFPLISARNIATVLGLESFCLALSKQWSVTNERNAVKTTSYKALCKAPFGPWTAPETERGRCPKRHLSHRRKQRGGNRSEDPRVNFLRILPHQSIPVLYLTSSLPRFLFNFYQHFSAVATLTTVSGTGYWRRVNVKCNTQAMNRTAFSIDCWLIFVAYRREFGCIRAPKCLRVSVPRFTRLLPQATQVTPSGRRWIDRR